MKKKLVDKLLSKSNQYKYYKKGYAKFKKHSKKLEKENNNLKTEIKLNEKDIKHQERIIWELERQLKNSKEDKERILYHSNNLVRVRDAVINLRNNMLLNSMKKL